MILSECWFYRVVILFQLFCKYKRRLFVHEHIYTRTSLYTDSTKLKLGKSSVVTVYSVQQLHHLKTLVTASNQKTKVILVGFELLVKSKISFTKDLMLPLIETNCIPTVCNQWAYSQLVGVSPISISNIHNFYARD